MKKSKMACAWMGSGLLITVIALVLPTTSFSQTSYTSSPYPHTECVSFSKNLGLGSRDATAGDREVHKLQTFLSRRGYFSTEPTGYFGPITLEAVKRFQSDYETPVTGFVGTYTRQAIRYASCGTETHNTPTPSSINEDVLVPAGVPSPAQAQQEGSKPSPTPQPQTVSVSTGDVCTNVGGSIKSMIRRSDGGTYTTTYNCMTCAGVTPERPGNARWMPVEYLTVTPLTMCDARSEYRKVETMTYWTDPHNQCHIRTITTTENTKTEVPKSTVTCQSNTCPSRPIDHTLACMALDKTLSTWSESTLRWDSNSSPPLGTPPGSPEYYRATKSVEQTVEESAACPSPTRTTGPDKCEVGGDVGHFGISCPPPPPPKSPTPVPPPPKPSPCPPQPTPTPTTKASVSDETSSQGMIATIFHSISNFFGFLLK